MKKEVKVLLFGKTSQAKKEIEALFHEVQINLENNYKDLAISARKQAEVKLAEYQAAGELKEKEYKKLKEAARRIYKTNGRISSLICSRELVEK